VADQPHRYPTPASLDVERLARALAASFDDEGWHAVLMSDDGGVMPAPLPRAYLEAIAREYAALTPLPAEPTLDVERLVKVSRALNGIHWLGINHQNIIDSSERFHELFMGALDDVETARAALEEPTP